MRFNRYSAVGAALFATLLLTQLGSSAAQADDPTVVFDEPSSLTVEYGQSWQFHAVGRPTAVGVGESYGGRAELHGGPPSYVLSTYAQYYSSPDYKTTIDVYPSYEQAALTVGTYTIDAIVTVSLFETEDYASSATPATLIVKPAAMGIELRVLTDSSDPRGAIVSARFTGRFVDEYQSSFFPGSAKSPAGQWHIAIKDADGELVTESTTERAAGDDVLATSFYWSEAEPGEKYTASAEFVPSGSSAENFTITAPQDFSYTAPTELRPVPTSTATAKPDAELAEPTGFGLPLWLVVVAGIIIIGLGALVTLLALRLRRRGSASTEVAP